MFKKLFILTLLSASHYSYSYNLSTTEIETKLETNILQLLSNFQMSEISYTPRRDITQILSQQINSGCGTHLLQAESTEFQLKGAYTFHFVTTREYWTPLYDNYQKLNHWQVTSVTE